MLCARLLTLAIFCLATTTFTIAGSFPAGTATHTFDAPDGTINLGDGSSIGSDGVTAAGSPVAGIYGAALRLIDKNTTNAIGSFKLPDLDPGSVARSFDVRFSVTMNGIAGSPAGEGWSFNFGRIPPDNGTGEGGFPPLTAGLTIAFDTLGDDGGSGSIEILVGGVTITNIPRTFTMSSVSQPLVMHWDSAGLDLSYENRTICTDLRTPGFGPGVGNIFAFTARTTTNTMDVFIDNLKVTTVPLPAIETGGPIISEFMANNTEFEDEFADKPDWIELLNGSSNVVDLTGWYLTDSKQNLTKWKINGVTLLPYNYLLVFASGKDRLLSVTSFYHVGFSLANSGGFVALVKPDGTTIASSYEYGPQERNVSFGEKGPERTRGYMYPASPGLVNTIEPSPGSLTPEVNFSHPGGFISEPITLALSVSNAPGAQIRYTLDRTEPTLNSLLYADPLTVTQITMVRARAYWTNHLPSVVSSRTFIRIDGTFTNYNNSGEVFDSNLPIIYVDSFGVNVDGSTGGTRPFRLSYAVVIPPDPKTGRAKLTSPPEYAGPAGVHVRGESSAGFDQKSYSLEIWDNANKDTDASLLGMPADSDWVLYGPWSEKTLMRNKLIFDWMRELRGEDGSAVRTRFVELFFNQVQTASRQISFNNSTYRGVYVLMEKLKRGGGRVPLENLNDKTIDPQLITGGYIFRKDKDDALKNNWTTTRFGIPLQSFDPDRLNTNQLTYLRNYITSFETALNGANYRNFTNGYQAYIDTDTFIDFMWMTELGKQVDGYVFSTYWHKDRDGRIRAGPLWDFNIALGNASYGSGESPVGWLYDNAAGTAQLWYPRLLADPEYKLAHWDRWWQMRRTIWDTNAIMATIDRHMTNLLDNYSGFVSNRAPASVQNPVARHFRRWPRLGTIDWPNPAAETTIRHWQGEVAYMKNWIYRRVNWLDDQSMRSSRNAFRPPDFSHSGGYIAGPIDLTLAPYQRTDPATTFPTGDIYYTLDNSDPRLSGGAISGAALKYTQPIRINSSLTVNARLLSGTTWSPLGSATFFHNALPANATNLVVSELMFRPGPLSTGEITGGIVTSSGFEFIELRNIANQPVDLTAVRFTQGVEFDFNYVPVASRLLQPGESAVVVSDPRAFKLRYPNVHSSKVLGRFRGRLDSGGEIIELVAKDGSDIKEFRYDDDLPWPPAGDGAGRSLVLNNPAANPNPAEPARWMVSAKAAGTPGESGLGADAFTGDPLKDTDGDALPDLYEFLFGSDPENPGSGIVPKAALAKFDSAGSQVDHLTFRFQRRLDSTRFKYTIEMSQDLKTWTPADSNLVLVSSVANRDGGLTELYRAGTPVLSSPMPFTFYRVRIQQQ